ncbi:3-hydroxyacyl-CoA dehydrogenase family protein [Halopseudomonas pachastrellae]|nr:3-hydroxyacyl-CoA dehydrogenase family protein [Halopseudomonas pachastrellae]
MPLLGAAQTLVTNGVSTPEMVDRTYMITNRGVALGPFGIMDVIGMKTCYDVLSYWGHQNNDPQTLRNAAYIKEQLIDQARWGCRPAPATISIRTLLTLRQASLRYRAWRRLMRLCD